MKLENCYPDYLEDAKKRNVPLFLPVGTIEYHSMHLPLGTDTQVAYHICERIEEQKEIIIAPPVWYGCASYAVRGPEGNSIDMDGKVLNDTMYNIYMSLIKSGFRQIYTVLFHQTEEPNPTETACLDASRRVIFKYLEETRGIGWWGSREMQNFYSTLENADNPWSWIRVMPIYPPRSLEEDHAGEFETSWLWELRPDLVRPDKFGVTDDWFAESSVNASREKGKEAIDTIVSYWLERLK